MLLDCSCPSPTALVTVPNVTCVDVIGKIGKMFFQRLDDAGNTFVNGVNGIEEATSWAGLPDAVDDTKVIVTPVLEDVEFVEPDILTEGENLDGAPITIDSGPATITAMIRNPTKEMMAGLRALGCERNLTVYFVDALGKIVARQVNTDDHAGFIISPDTFVVRDPAKGTTRADQFKLMIQFSLPAGWFELADTTVPEAGFNPLVDVIPS